MRIWRPRTSWSPTAAWSCSTSRWPAGARRSTTSHGCTCSSTCSGRSRSSGVRVIAPLQAALLRGFDPGSRPGTRSSACSSMLHHVNHLGTLALRREALAGTPGQRARAAHASPVDRGRARGGHELMGRVLGLGARLSKLRAMSAAEVVHRVRYKAALEIERRQHRADRPADPERLQRALVADLRGGEWRARLIESRRTATARFFSSTGERDAVRALFHGAYAAELADTVAKAADARQHRFAFFGREFEYGREIAWHADPVTGREWPHVFHADVPVHGGDVGYGDVKHVWELSRHQFLIDLGKSWFLTGNADDLQALRRYGPQLDRRQPVWNRRQLVMRARAGVPGVFVAVGLPPHRGCARRRVPLRVARGAARSRPLPRASSRALLQPVQPPDRRGRGALHARSRSAGVRRRGTAGGPRPRPC